jgi:acetyltransferase-like isoleucine patch superfamily enzyme
VKLARIRSKLRSAYCAILKPILRPVIADLLLSEPLIFGDRSRVRVAPTAKVNNAILNVSSGTIVIEDFAFFGHSVAVLTGTHDYEALFYDRQFYPTSGRDIEIRTGAWIATGAIIIGPCIVGEHAVVAAGAVVIKDVPPFSIVAGVPARIVGQVRSRPNPVQAQSVIANTRYDASQ